MIVKNGMIAGKTRAKYWADKRTESLKKKPLKRTAIKKGRYKIKKKTKKLAANERIYQVLRKDYLEDNPTCQCGREGCLGVATEVHHKKGRGIWLTVVKYFMAVCAVCHRWIETHPAEAKRLGYSVSRLNKETPENEIHSD